MNSSANAALSSWSFHGPAIAVLIATALIYARGWLRGRRLLRGARDPQKFSAFFAGLFLLFLATESPLDAFDSLYLSAHMTQHLLLMMFAPPLILLGDPLLPILRGLPKTFVKEGLGPFLSWPALKGTGRVLVSPVVAWLAFALSTVCWHLPVCYELALRSPFWHGVQHASFFWTGILFWWPIIQPVPSKTRMPLWAKIPYLLFADIVNTALSAFFVFSGRLLYPSYETAHIGGFGVQDDQTVAGLIMWVPGSLVYLLPAFTMAMGLLRSRNLEFREEWRRVRERPAVRRRFPWRSLARRRPAMQMFMLLFAVAVIAEGWFGPQATPLNLAGVLPWIHWRALSVFALLLVGNLFCMSCPFTLVRDMARRVLPAKLRWPRILRNKWLPSGLLVLYFWAYEAFGLWDSPFVTAWIIVGYFAAAVLIDGIFRGASFCKYVCPIGQFHFVSSLISPSEVRIKSPVACQTCNTYDCIRGNEGARGCELYLFQPKKSGNLDCTFCLECVKACPHENLAIFPVWPGKTVTEDPYRSSLGRLSKRTDLAALVLIFVFGAWANAAGMVSPVMMWEHAWHARLGSHAMSLVIGVFVAACVVVTPALAVSVCALLNGLVCDLKENSVDFARRLVFTLVPLGFGMWGAHLLYHFATGWDAPWTIVQHRFLGLSEQEVVPRVPDWLTAAQILMLNGGLLLSLYLSWRIASQNLRKVRTALALVSPWAVLAVALYCSGVWILFQPMQMRGMVH